jgi:hypothetical protein
MNIDCKKPTFGMLSDLKRKSEGSCLLELTNFVYN